MKPKYTKGTPYNDIVTLVIDLSRGHCVFDGDKCQNPGWMMNQQVSLLARRVLSGGIRRAIPKPEIAA